MEKYVVSIVMIFICLVVEKIMQSLFWKGWSPWCANIL